MSKQSAANVLIVEKRQEIGARLLRLVRDTSGITPVGLVDSVTTARATFLDLKPRLVVLNLAAHDAVELSLIRDVATAVWESAALVVAMPDDPVDVVAAIRAGAVGYVQTTPKLPTLADDIQVVLAGGCPISPTLAQPVLDAVRAGTGHLTLPQTIAGLTEREAEVLQAVSKGLKRYEVGRKLGISTGTVGNHITSIYRKLGVASNIEAVAKAARLGLL